MNFDLSFCIWKSIENNIDYTAITKYINERETVSIELICV